MNRRAVGIRFDVDFGIGYYATWNLGILLCEFFDMEEQKCEVRDY